MSIELQIKSLEQAMTLAEYDRALEMAQALVMAKGISDQQRFVALQHMGKVHAQKGNEIELEDCLDELEYLLHQFGKPTPPAVEALMANLRRIRMLKHDVPVRALDLIAIGYWHSERKPQLPMPQAFIEPHWEEEEKAMVIRYLKRGRLAIMYRGFSICRICNKMLGSECWTDGTYIFPDFLFHYLEEHQVKLPQQFINHVRAKQFLQGAFTIQVESIDYSWWEQVSL